MKTGDVDHPYQPTVILILLKHKGKIIKKKIHKIMKNEYDDTTNIHSTHAVYNVLSKYDIIKITGNVVEFLDYDQYDEEQIKIISDICDNIICGKQSSIKQQCIEFKYWINKTIEFNHELYNKNKSIILNICEYEQKLDKLLTPKNPRIYHYNEDVSNEMIKIVKRVQENTDIVNIKTDEQFDDYIHLENITPILFYMNNNYPIINDLLQIEYKNISKIFGINDNLSMKISEYNLDVGRWHTLLKKFKKHGISSLYELQIFCYWRKKYFQNPEQNPDDWTILNFPQPIKNADFDIKKDAKIGLVILLDILGTKKLMYDEDGMEKIQLFINNAKKHFQPSVDEDHNMIRGAEFSYFSDTIMITVEDKKYRNFYPFLNIIGEALGNFILYAAGHNIFLRGCISYGEYVSSEHVSIGKAVSEAGANYELANWIGVTVTPSLYIKILLNTNSDIDLFFKKWTIPTKKGTEIGYALNFKKALQRNRGEQFKNLIYKLTSNLYHETEYDVSIKYRNTLEFIDSLQ